MKDCAESRWTSKSQTENDIWLLRYLRVIEMRESGLQFKQISAKLGVHPNRGRAIYEKACANRREGLL